MTSHPERTPPRIPGYEIIRLIGLGGMGEVYLARQLVLNRPVAVKFLTRTAGDPPHEYEVRFRREAELMARVSHPNVVTIFDFGTVEGRPYLVMEYVEGGDLRSRMVPDLPMKVDEIRTIIKPVIRAVEYLHRRGIVHRDMKPENILIHHEETPKVTDFGIAVLDFAIGSLTRTGHALGTPGYVAPEQQYGLKVDERADQFSLAALCYEMATGRKPLGSFPPPARLNPKLGREAGEAILRALSEDPSDRFRTIGEFGEALDRGLAHPGRPKSSTGRAVLVASLAILGVLVGVGLVTFFGPHFAKKPVDRPAIEGPANVPGPPPLAPGAVPRIVARSVDMALVEIPPGEFWMGTHASDPAALPNELPRHFVRISRPFYLGEKEVTVGQFRKFVEATGHRTSAETKPDKEGALWGGCMFNAKLNQWEQKPELNWRHPDGENLPVDDRPVVQVSWYDAVAFCNWLSRVEGRPFRLPTEAEWEYACRAGTQARWSSGDDPASLAPFAWTLQNADNAFHRVGSKRPNPFGLFDMHGNAWEWCSDEFGPYSADMAVDPQGPPPKEVRVIRGGSFDWDDVTRTRSASRHNYPSYMSYYNYGFRVCSPERP